VDVEDEVPEGQIGTQAHFRHMKKLAWWFVVVQLAGMRAAALGAARRPFAARELVARSLAAGCAQGSHSGR